MLPRLLAVLALTAGLASTAGAASAATIPVDTTADVVVAGGTTSLREAISTANSNGSADTVQLVAGQTYELDRCGAFEDLNSTGDLDSTSSEGVTIDGNGATIAQTCGNDRVLHATANDGALTLDDVRVTGGSAADGAALLFGNDLDLVDSTVSGNAAGASGRVITAEGGFSGARLESTDSTVGPNVGTGIGFSSGTVQLDDSTVSQNTGRGIGMVDGNLNISGSTISDNGGDGARTTEQGDGPDMTVSESTISGNGGTGVICSACGDLTITDSTITGNEPSGTFRGGGVEFVVDLDEPDDVRVARIERTTISGNTSSGPGGGVALTIIENSDGGPPRIELVDSTVSGNTATGPNGRGAGVDAAIGDVAVTNSTVSGNTAGPSGGGIRAALGEVRLEHATIAGNSAVIGANVSADSLESSRSLVVDGEGGGTDCAIGGSTTSTGYNVDGDSSCGFTEPTDEPGTGDNTLLPLADNGGPTQTRLPGPLADWTGAVPFGDCAAPTDQRGVSRPQGIDCEPGAVEIAESLQLLAASSSTGGRTVYRIALFDGGGGVTTPFPVSGLAGSDRIVGLDTRPATGEIYALAHDPTTVQLYTLVVGPGLTATATPIGPRHPRQGASNGFDFNPVVDRIRHVSDGELNRRYDPLTGALVMEDTPLLYAAGDPRFGRNPQVVGAAYDRNDTDAGTGTTLYGIDSATDRLVTVDPPNDGSLHTVGSLRRNVSGNVGFDIAGEDDQAIAALQPSPCTPCTNAESQIYTVDLGTGETTLLGQAGGAKALNSLTRLP